MKVAPIPKPEARRSKLATTYAFLKAEIARGRWAVGEQIPTEVELAESLDCGRSTIGGAIARLVHDGLVERKTRTGTRVLRFEPSSANGSGAASGSTGGKVMQLDAFAFIYSSELHEGIFRMVSGFQLAARERNRRVVTLTTGTDCRKEAEFIGRLTEFDVKGAVVNPLVSTVQEQMHFSSALANPSLPVVLAGTNLPGSGCPSVLADNFHVGYTMTRHLIDQGLRRIGFFSNHAWAQFMRDRYQGYRWALKSAGLAEQPEYVFLEEGRRVDFSDPLQEPKKLASAYLASAGPMEGVVCADDFLAFGLILAAREMGLRIPDDLKVTGHGDFSPPDCIDIPVTSYRVPYETIGRESFRVLESCLASRPVRPGSLLIEGELVVRPSTG